MKAALLNYLLEVSVCFEVLYLFHWLALQGTTLLQASRVYLLGMATAAWLVPLLTFEAALPVAETVPELAQLSQTITVVEQPVRVAQWQREVTFSDVLLWVYLGGVAVFGGCFVWRLGRLFGTICRAERVKHGGHWQINTHGAWPTSSFACFLFWDETAPLTAEAQEQVRRHESVHIREGHTFDILYAELLRVVFWINPAVHLFETQLQTLHEHRADAVAARQFGAQAYLNLLNTSVLQRLQPAFSHSFNQCSILQRTAMLRKSATSRRRLWLLALALPLVGGLLSAFSFEQTAVMPNPLASRHAVFDTAGQKPVLRFSAVRGKEAVLMERGANLSMKNFPDAITVQALAPDPSSDEGNRYEVRRFVVYLVEGSRPLVKIEAQGATAALEGVKKRVDLEDSQKKGAKAERRLVLEVTEVMRIAKNGEETKTGVTGSPIRSVGLVE
jgi:beta-lactamase regulating signal transducer with metallopeptidase domain